MTNFPAIPQSLIEEAEASKGRRHEGKASQWTPDFRTLYEAQFSYVLNTLRRLGVPRRDLEDLVQEVFYVVHKQLGNYDPSRPLRPWLFGIAFRVASDYLSRARHTREVFEDSSHVPDGSRSPEEEAQAAQVREAVLRALMALDLDKRVVFVMHDLDGLPMREIAEALSVSANTLYSRLRAGREIFTRTIRELQTKGGGR